MVFTWCQMAPVNPIGARSVLRVSTIWCVPLRTPSFSVPVFCYLLHVASLHNSLSILVQFSYSKDKGVGTHVFMQQMPLFPCLSLPLALVDHQASLEVMSKGHMIADMVAIIGRHEYCYRQCIIYTDSNHPYLSQALCGQSKACICTWRCILHVK